jgi:hypothetical protein
MAGLKVGPVGIGKLVNEHTLNAKTILLVARSHPTWRMSLNSLSSPARYERDNYVERQPNRTSWRHG